MAAKPPLRPTDVCSHCQGSGRVARRPAAGQTSPEDSVPYDGPTPGEHCLACGKPLSAHTVRKLETSGAILVCPAFMRP